MRGTPLCTSSQRQACASSAGSAGAGSSAGAPAGRAALARQSGRPITTGVAAGARVHGRTRIGQPLRSGAGQARTPPLGRWHRSACTWRAARTSTGASAVAASRSALHSSRLVGARAPDDEAGQQPALGRAVAGAAAPGRSTGRPCPASAGPAGRWRRRRRWRGSRPSRASAAMPSNAIVGSVSSLMRADYHQCPWASGATGARRLASQRTA